MTNLISFFSTIIKSCYQRKWIFYPCIYCISSCTLWIFHFLNSVYKFPVSKNILLGFLSYLKHYDRYLSYSQHHMEDITAFEKYISMIMYHATYTLNLSLKTHEEYINVQQIFLHLFLEIKLIVIVYIEERVGCFYLSS